MGPQFCWPNEGIILASYLKKPAYNDLSLAQWVSGQLANILLVEDQALSKNMFDQMAAAAVHIAMVVGLNTIPVLIVRTTMFIWLGRCQSLYTI